MKRIPAKIAVLFFVFGMVWIHGTDFLLEALFSQNIINKLQSIKGSIFIVITTILLYYLSNHYTKTIDRRQKDYLKLFKENPNPMCVYDTETQLFLTVNEMAVEKYGYTVEEFKKMNIAELLAEQPTNEEIAFVQNIGNTIDNSRIWHHKSKDGKEYYVRSYSHPTIFEGRKSRMTVVIDVTEKIKAQQQLSISEKKLRALINNTDDIIWLIDKEGFIITANESFINKMKELTGLVFTQEAKLNIRHLPKSGFVKNLLVYFDKALKGEHLNIEETIINKQMHTSEYYEIIVNPIMTDDGLIGVGCFARNITLRKQNEKRISHQVSTLKQIAWIQSHELRKPLANIMSLTALLKMQTEALDQSKEVISRLDQSCDELDSIVTKVVTNSAAIDKV